MSGQTVAASSSRKGPVTIITQTRVRPDAAAPFAHWQRETGTIVAGFPGFIEQTVMPPSPPEQVDWVILQRFASAAEALAWLNSDDRLQRVEEAQPMLVGHDDIHVVNDGASGALPAPVSAVISTRIKPGQEAAYHGWEQRIAAAQSKAPGFQGYRFEPPIPGVQDDWLAIVRFDTDANLQAWLDSPERHKLLQEAAPFTEEFHARIARTGFDHWFAAGPGERSSPAWKQNMLVLLTLYPVVFLFGALVQTPLLTRRAGLPFAVALFFGNVASVLLLNYLLPWTSNRFSWWLQPAREAARWIDFAGAGFVIGLYALSVFVFAWYF